MIMCDNIIIYYKKRQMDNKRSFTLVELIIVMVIVGILASIGMTQYTKVVEKGRCAEAKAILGTIRTAQIDYYLSNGSYTSSLNDLSVGAPTSCVSTHYFYYSITSAQATATRCTGGGCSSSGGKAPDAVSPYSITLTYDGGVWSGGP